MQAVLSVLQREARSGQLVCLSVRLPPSESQSEKWVRRSPLNNSFILGVDFGGTNSGATVIDATSGEVLLDESVEVPSLAHLGPERSMQQLMIACEQAMSVVGIGMDQVVALGLVTPGPAKSDSTISVGGSVNLQHTGWAGFNSRNAMSRLTGKPVFYTNDGNAAGLWAYRQLYGDSTEHILEAAILGTGLGGARVERGVLCTGFDGRAAEYGHIYIPAHKLLQPGQPLPRCNCGRESDAESWATLTALQNNLLPWYLQGVTDHPLIKIDVPVKRAYQVRTLADKGDELCRKIFAVQAHAVALLFEQLAMGSDADTYVIGGGICETSPEFRGWYLGEVKRHFTVWPEQSEYARIVFMEDGDEAGARGVALYARDEAMRQGLLT